jgi:hypothetical protein
LTFDLDSEKIEDYKALASSAILFWPTCLAFPIRTIMKIIYPRWHRLEVSIGNKKSLFGKIQTICVRIELIISDCAKILPIILGGEFSS